MKKYVVFALVALALVGVAYAGTQYNWGTSFGGAWQTPDDTTAAYGAPLQIGAAPGVIQAGGAPLNLYSRTIAQLNALTPTTTGQLLYCSDCVYTHIVVSSGSTTAGEWEGVYTTTSTVKPS